MKDKCLILGAGVTGLSAGINSEREIYEAKDAPGGICTSYYLSPNGKRSYSCIQEESYRFEIGGGHWIFGADNKTLNFINSLSPTKTYQRKSAVYLPDLDSYVPYPLQNHLFYLPGEIRNKALEEIMKSENKSVSTLADWLELNFGKILCELFFFPFHELYTAGLYTEVAPQDKFKTPIDKNLILKGAKEKTPAVGYNARFVYPERGLNNLVGKMAQRCKVHYDRRVVQIDTKKKQVLFGDGSRANYDALISTLPLNRMVELSKLELDGPPPPYTSVLVLNIGAKKGSKCPEYHWLYIPKSKSGFHRVGFYSNVDGSFLPKSPGANNDRVSIYVEKAYSSNGRPRDKDIKKSCDDILRELEEWRFINESEVIDPTSIEVAYTWSYPNSKWRQTAIALLRQHGIHQIGRYGLWEFQGVAKSIRDGLEIRYGR